MLLLLGEARLDVAPGPVRGPNNITRIIILNNNNNNNNNITNIQILLIILINTNDTNNNNSNTTTNVPKARVAAPSAGAAALHA